MYGLRCTSTLNLTKIQCFNGKQNFSCFRCTVQSLNTYCYILWMFYCRLTNTLTLSTTDQWLHPQIRTTAIGANNWLYKMTSYRALLRKEYKFMDLIDCIVKYWCIVLINYVRNNAILFESTKSCLTYNQK